MGYLYIYLTIGLVFSVWLSIKLTSMGYTSDDILNTLPEKERDYLYEHPTSYKVCLYIVFVIIAALWPIALYKIYNNIYDDER